jgi:pyruvate/2-oxoglutarate/acetoin dehydrogenase E1 component
MAVSPSATVRVSTAGATMREAILEGIGEEMERDEAVIVIGQDVRAFEGPLKCTAGLWPRFGDERVVEMPIAESAMTSFGVGAALAGMRPVIDIMFSDLLPIATTPLIQLAAPLRYYTAGEASCPMVVRTRGGDGPYRAHPQNYEAIFSHSPGLIVVAPSTATDAKGLIKSAIRADDPVLFLENIFLYNAYRERLPDGDHLIPLSRARTARAGKDLTIVAYGRTVRTSLAAADRLAEQGIEVEIVDLRTVNPLDEEAVFASVRRTRRLLVVHEAWANGGIGAEVVTRATAACFDDLAAAPSVIGAPPVPVPWAEPLRDALLPTVAGIVAEAQRLCGGGADG